MGNPAPLILATTFSAEVEEDGTGANLYAGQNEKFMAGPHIVAADGGALAVQFAHVGHHTRLTVAEDREGRGRDID
jgi:hypothetical protein